MRVCGDRRTCPSGHGPNSGGGRVRRPWTSAWSLQWNCACWCRCFWELVHRVVAVRLCGSRATMLSKTWTVVLTAAVLVLEPHNIPLCTFCGAVAAFVIFTHRSNTARMRAGKENRVRRLCGRFDRERSRNGAPGRLPPLLRLLADGGVHTSGESLAAELQQKLEPPCGKVLNACVHSASKCRPWRAAATI